MQDLPILSEPAGAQKAYTTWPAYRVSNSQLKTMQWRINDCYRQMRFPEPEFASEATIALTHYLAVTAKGAPYRGPGTKR
jgi:sulfur-oxidizing protein SoxA